MKHFVAYHNSDKRGPFKRPLRDGQSRVWDAAKRFREETIVGNRLWAIKGSASPKRYRLLGSGAVSRLQPDHGAGLKDYRVDAHFKPIDVTDLSSFKRLREEQRSFSYGLNKIKDRRAIAGLKALLGKGLPRAGDGMRGAGKTDWEPIAGRKPSAISTIRRSPSAASEIARQLVPEKHLPDVLKAVAHSVRLPIKRLRPNGDFGSVVIA